MLELIFLVMKLAILALAPIVLALAAIVAAVLRWMARWVLSKANRGR